VGFEPKQCKPDIPAVLPAPLPFPSRRPPEIGKRDHFPAKVLQRRAGGNASFASRVDARGGKALRGRAKRLYQKNRTRVNAGKTQLRNRSCRSAQADNEIAGQHVDHIPGLAQPRRNNHRAARVHIVKLVCFQYANDRAAPRSRPPTSRLHRPRPTAANQHDAKFREQLPDALGRRASGTIRLRIGDHRALKSATGHLREMPKRRPPPAAPNP